MESGRSSCRFLTAFPVIVALLAVSHSLWAQEPLISTKWAMDDDRYAQLHNAPYSTDPVQRRAQIRQEKSDASFQEENYGVYLGGGGALSNGSVGIGEIGAFKMPTAWSTVRFGAIGMVAEGKPMAGGELGVRLHTPTRLAPYVGLSGVLELSGVSRHVSYNRYYYDSSGHRMNNPRWGYYPTGMAAIVPEVGISYWLNSSSRLNLGASYYVATGQQPDFLAVGLSMDFALRPPQQSPVYYPPWADSLDSEPYFATDDPAAGFEFRNVEPPNSARSTPVFLKPPGVEGETFENYLPRPLSGPTDFIPSPPEALPPSLLPQPNP